MWGGSYNLLLTLRGGKLNCTLPLYKTQSIAPLDEELIYSVSFGDRSRRRYEGDERSWIVSDHRFYLLWFRARDFSWFPRAYSDVGACPCVGALLKPVNCRSSEIEFEIRKCCVGHHSLNSLIPSFFYGQFPSSDVPLNVSCCYWSRWLSGVCSLWHDCRSILMAPLNPNAQETVVWIFFPSPRFDVTESMLCTVAIQLLTAAVGPWVWNYTVKPALMLPGRQWHGLSRGSTFVMHVGTGVKSIFLRVFHKCFNTRWGKNVCKVWISSKNLIWLWSFLKVSGFTWKQSKNLPGKQQSFL